MYDCHLPVLDTLKIENCTYNWPMVFDSLHIYVQYVIMGFESSPFIMKGGTLVHY